MHSAFDPEEFLELARFLKEDSNPPSAGRLRTSISRAYYAAFLKTKIKLESLGYSFSNDSRIHWDVRAYLREKLKKSDISSDLERLFDFRVKADYDTYARISEQLCGKCIKLSEQIINLIEVI